MALFTVLWLGVPAVIGLALGLLPNPSMARLCVIAASGILLAALCLVLWWHSSPTTYSQGCECQDVYGRWWDPYLSVFVVSVSAGVWILGALFGVWTRAIVDRQWPARDM